MNIGAVIGDVEKYIAQVLSAAVLNNREGGRVGEDQILARQQELSDK